MTTKLKIPKIRFKEFSWDWEEKKLWEVWEIVWWWTPDTFKNEYWGWNIQWFTPTELKSKYVSNSNRTITDLWLKKSSAKILPKNTLLLSSRATIWDISIALNECTTNQWFQSIIVNNKNDFNFFYFLINNNKKELIKKASGSTFLEISKTEILKLKIFSPQLPEQQKIASFLLSVDEKIEKIKEKKKNLEEYKKWIMQKIFSQEIRFKDENWEEFWEWEEKKLGEICEKQSSNISANTLETNTWNYKIYWATWFLKYIDFYQEENDYISIVKDWAWVWRVLYCEWKSSVLWTLDKIKPKKWTNLYFLLSVLRNIDFTKYTIWSTIPHIYFKDYWKEKLLFPTLKEQEKIADFLSGIDEKIEKVSDELGKMEEFKKGLLQGMFV